MYIGNFTCVCACGLCERPSRVRKKSPVVLGIVKNFYAQCLHSYERSLECLRGSTKKNVTVFYVETLKHTYQLVLSPCATVFSLLFLLNIR